MSRRRSALVAGALALVAWVAACSNNEGGAGASRTSEASATASAAGTASPTGAFSASTNVNTGLPEGFPDSFPIPDGAVLANSVVAAGGYMLGFSSDQTREELCSFFDENLPSNGWTVNSKTHETDSQGKPFTDYDISGHGFSGNVYVHGAPAPPGDDTFFVGLLPE